MCEKKIWRTYDLFDLNKKYLADENIDEFLPLNKRTYGSFDQTTLPYEKLPQFSDQIENDSEQLDLAINALVKSVVASGKRQNLNFWILNF